MAMAICSLRRDCSRKFVKSIAGSGKQGFTQREGRVSHASFVFCRPSTHATEKFLALAALARAPAQDSSPDSLRRDNKLCGIDLSDSPTEFWEG